MNGLLLKTFGLDTFILFVSVKLVFFVTTLIISLCIVCYLGRSLKRAQERYNTYERQPPQPRSLMDLLGAFLSFVGRSNRPQPRDLSSFFSFIFGNFLEPKNCSVSWEWSDPQVVGETMTFFVKVKIPQLEVVSSCFLILLMLKSVVVCSMAELT